LYLIDDRTKRVGTGKPLKMFIARVVLGRTFISPEPRQFQRPPCTGKSCHSDRCAKHNSFFDSVIATHKDAGKTRLLFREFIVYNLTQSYPEFLVKYERK